MRNFWIGLTSLILVFATNKIALCQQAPSDVATIAAKGPSAPVNAWNGSYRQSIPVSVPAFRELTPNLSLSYDSASSVRSMSGVGGQVGLGWSLDGVSSIQRISGTPTPAANTEKAISSRGLPAWGAAGFPSDAFALNGEELLKCSEVQVASSTPSCALTADTTTSLLAFASHIESFSRIRQNTANNTWEITSGKGVKSIYRTTESTDSTQTYRWYISTVIDRRGNRVDYVWDCITNNTDCAISTVSYFNQSAATPVTQITFYSEVRTDPVSYATGREIRFNTRRIKSIVVDNGIGSTAGSQLSYGLMSYIHRANAGYVEYASHRAKAVLDNNPATYTATVVNPGQWLKLDMGASFSVSSVKLLNRADCCGTLLNGAVVSLRDEAGATIYTFPAISGAVNGSLHTLTTTSPVVARFVYIAASPNQSLQLAELDVMRTMPPGASYHPHAPSSICGTPVAYDANGNTLSYDGDGPGPELPTAFYYDLENRPKDIIRNGLQTMISYGPDGERASKGWNSDYTVYLGNDADVLTPIPQALSPPTCTRMCGGRA